MSLIDEEANLQAVTQAAAIPEAARPKPEKPSRSAWSAIPRAVPVIAGELAAGAAEIGAGVKRSIDQMNQGDPRKMARQGVDWNGRNEVSDSIRGGLDTAYRPDPATATEVENIVFGFTRGAGKILGLALTTGPAALPIFVASEGMEATDQLQRQGVDDTTARKIGAVTALTTAAGAAIPVAPLAKGFTGNNIAKVVGLAGISGPATFMAQQQMSSDILSAANYAEIAKQYDPFDPVGLTVSMAAPLAFGAASLRGGKKNQKAAPALKESASVAPETVAPTASQDAVDAAMVYNLTLMRSAQDIRTQELQQNQPTAVVEPAQFAIKNGVASQVVTERGLTAPVQYRLIEADALTASHSNDLTANPAFPAELQPRDRTRAASAEQIARIENQIRPELLGESIKASDGAPIVGSDGVVESGNARTIALRRAYDSGKADAYREWLASNAGKFGLTADDVAGMNRPVLVRERMGNIDRAEFARQANESPIAAMSTTETAQADAARIKDLSGLVPNEDGSISMAGSRDFLRAFMQSVPPGERGTLMQADGQLSQAGMQRVRNAVFAKAYGDAEILAALSESTNSNIKNILSGLMRAAPEVARLKDLIEAGARQPMDFAPDLVRGVRELSALRERGMGLDAFLAQGDMLGDGLPPALNNLLVGLSENARSPKRIAEMVKRMVEAVDSLGDPRQAGLLDDAPAPTRENVTADAVERMRTLTDEQIKGIEPETFKPSADPLMRSVADRVAMVEATAPDMPVGQDADGNPVTAADVMAAARREALEGTDAELGAADADLIRVAADCALTTGD